MIPSTRSQHIFLISITTVLISNALCDDSSQSKYSRKVLLVSMDGFRWDYIHRADTPNFDKMAREGARAEYIKGTFVTKTFPSHYTIATGLYEESHGIVGNKFYDPVFDEVFTKRSTESKWFLGEPIWVTATKQGRHSATYYWPGSFSEIQGYRPNIRMTSYNESITFHERVDTVIDWFKTDQTDLATLYFHEPDHHGHKYGPGAQETLNEVQKMDAILGYLIQKMEEYNLIDTINLIVTSDHGMTDIDLETRMIDITQLINMSLIYGAYGHGAIINIRPKEGHRDAIFRALQHPHMTVFLKENIPEYWHYKNSRRIQPIVAVAEEGWHVTATSEKDREENELGGHGYDNRLASMRGIFYARGPNIRKNSMIGPTFCLVDIYPMICELLEINPAPNNGSISHTQFVLLPSKTAYNYPNIVLIVFTLLVCR